MREQNENLADKTGTVCVLAMTLMNLLIILIIIGAVWMIFQAVDNPTVYSFVNGKFLSQ